MIRPAPCCRQNATVSPAHAATETLSQSAGSSRRSRIARSDWVPDGCLSASLGFTVELQNAIHDALQKAIPRPSTPYYTEFTTIVQAQVCNFLTHAIGGTRPSADAVASKLATGLADAASERSPPQKTIAACSSLPWTVSRPCSLALSGFEPLPANVAYPRSMTGTSA
jgi:hypothetical protein